MKSISLKKKYVSTDGWRGYEEPINAVCGANNTGNWSDSPCPESVCLDEIKQASKILRANKIRFKRTWTRTSNVFCIHCYLVTLPEDVEKAKELIKPLIDTTRLLYIA